MRLYTMGGALQHWTLLCGTILKNTDKNKGFNKGNNLVDAVTYSSLAQMYMLLVCNRHDKNDVRLRVFI